jgi:16S rRNA (uracil1498-N3)-methyltransferase
VHRFAIAPERIDGPRVTFDRQETRHLARVLRLGPGDLVLATDGLGHEYTVRIETLGVGATGTVLDAAPRLTESPVAVTLVQGIPKGDKMEAIIRAATELGATRIAPALTARTVVSLEENGWRERARRWQRVAREAAKQCGRAVVPEVMEPRPLPRVLQDAGGNDLKICLWEGERRPLGALLRRASPLPRTVAVAVGPEGGLSAAEVAHARGLDWAIAGLGPRILRTETASVTVLALIEATFGDLLGDMGVSRKGDELHL